MTSLINGLGEARLQVRLSARKGYEISSYNELRIRRIETYGHDV
jgi:hypothetical protein